MSPQRGMARGRRLVYARSGGLCEVRIPGVCLGRGMSWHHRKNRSQGGTWAPSNGLHTCGDGTTGCHGALTNTNGRAEEFRAAGWIVPSYQDPTTVPVLIPGLFFVLLSDDGSYVEIPPSVHEKGDRSA